MFSFIEAYLAVRDTLRKQLRRKPVKIDKYDINRALRNGTFGISLPAAKQDELHTLLDATNILYGGKG